MKPKEYLNQNIDTIGCIICGECCPNSCQYKQDNLCKIHPNIPETNGEDKRFPVCGLSPTELLVHFSIACPPVIADIEEKTGIRISQYNTELNVPHINQKQLISVIEKL